MVLCEIFYVGIFFEKTFFDDNSFFFHEISFFSNFFSFFFEKNNTNKFQEITRLAALCRQALYTLYIFCVENFYREQIFYSEIFFK